MVDMVFVNSKAVNPRHLGRSCSISLQNHVSIGAAITKGLDAGTTRFITMRFPIHLGSRDFDLPLPEEDL
jgi:hypothetical protein